MVALTEGREDSGPTQNVRAGDQDGAHAPLGRRGGTPPLPRHPRRAPLPTHGPAPAHAVMAAKQHGHGARTRVEVEDYRPPVELERLPWAPSYPRREER
jgi:hypothetical protein